jgi:CheY-like chemotaxis protein
MSINILLADDSITIQKVIGIIFGGDEYTVTVVDNGKAAVDKAIEIKPDVLLIDALMPGMSGYEVCEQIRAISELKTKPIILLTGSFEPFDEDKAKSCGADTFLSKPFESQQIVNKVAEMYELGKTRSSAAEIVEPVTPPPLPVETFETPAEEVATAPNDIWGAFTPPVETLESHEEAPEFTTVEEEPEAKVEEPVVADAVDQIGSEWVPVEEHTFEFEEDALAELPASDPEIADDKTESAFGEISFEEAPELESHEEVQIEEAPELESHEEAVAEPVAETAFTEKAMPEILASIPTFEEDGKPDFVRSAAMSVIHPGPSIDSTTPAFEPVSASAALPAEPVALTEEQLRAAISLVSKDVIERIVWEIVPDLAEAMIKEAIRKIKEGQ